MYVVTNPHTHTHMNKHIYTHTYTHMNKHIHTQAIQLSYQQFKYLKTKMFYFLLDVVNIFPCHKWLSNHASSSNNIPFYTAFPLMIVAKEGFQEIRVNCNSYRCSENKVSEQNVMC